jgi:hypothetical protein
MSNIGQRPSGRSRPARFRGTAGLLAGLLLTLVAVPAFGQSRSGPTLRLLPGAGFAAGRYEYAGTSNPGFGLPVSRLQFDTTLMGPTGGLAIDAGWWLSSRFSLAAELGGSIQLGGSDRELGATTINQTVGWQTLLIADYHLSDRPGLHLSGGAGYARMGFLSEQNDIGSVDNIVDPRGVSGATFMLGTGYDFNDTFGLVLRGNYSHLSNEHSSYHPVMVSVLASFQIL